GIDDGSEAQLLSSRAACLRGARGARAKTMGDRRRHAASAGTRRRNPRRTARRNSPDAASKQTRIRENHAQTAVRQASGET
ncbi:hypothetical protein, partial [Burkholderia multivorans]|uniref:hypothetical protein n=1 Tax=Burkholderia multivorans TaxID=87883 RepID=UPI001C65A5BA